MKKTSKFLVALCIMLSILMLGVTCFATDGMITPDNFKPTSLNSSTTSGLVNVGQMIVSVVQTVGVLVAVVILLVLGIKYMMGSAEEKADYKKSMIPYLVGAVLIFAASAITGIVYEMAKAIGS